MSTSYVVNANDFPRVAKLISDANVLTANSRIHLIVGKTVGNLGKWSCGQTETSTRLVMIFDGSEIPTRQRETVTLSLSQGLAVISEQKHMGQRKSAVIIVNEADAKQLLGH